MDSERGSGNSKNSMAHTESSHDDGDPIFKGKMSLSSSSSSSSASSFDPLTDSDDGEKDNSMTKSEQDGPSSPRAGVLTLNEVSSQTPEWSMISASPRAGPGHSQTSEWSMHSATPKQFPPMQMMGRPLAGYDPNRIPSSIFCSKPTNPMEWSVASNESLFSIHMGNNSFSTDHAMFGKSGELAKLDELSNFTSSQQPVTEDNKSIELNNAPSGLPTVIEVAAEGHRKSSSSMGDDSLIIEAADEMPKVVVKEAADETPKVVVKVAAEEHSKESMPPAGGARYSTSASNISDVKEMPPADGGRTSASTPRLSDESGNSSSSFAFPVLTGEGGRSTSVRVAPHSLQSKLLEKPESPSQSQAVTPKAGETRWFSWFRCWPLCC